jgi:hypothetical protein
MTTHASLFDNPLEPLHLGCGGCGTLWADPDCKRCIHSGYVTDLEKKEKQERKDEGKNCRPKAPPPVSTRPETSTLSALEAPKNIPARIQFEPHIANQPKATSTLKASKSFQLEATKNGSLNFDGLSARNPDM